MPFGTAQTIGYYLSNPDGNFLTPIGRHRFVHAYECKMYVAWSPEYYYGLDHHRVTVSQYVFFVCRENRVFSESG